MVLPCTCVHPAQDEIHGKGNRVHNPCKKVGDVRPVRCTVCGKEKRLNEK